MKEMKKIFVEEERHAKEYSNLNQEYPNYNLPDRRD
jgi:hypothetical protein